MGSKQMAALNANAALAPPYWEEAKKFLMKHDRIMKKLIPQYGDIHLTGRGDAFTTLARSIVGQQISVKAAATVWERLLTLCGACTPAKVLKFDKETLATCGLSKRKAEYIHDLASHFKSGSVHVDAWAEMDDEAVITELTQIRGIGRWTAEMFLMFNLMRPNILPLDDVGLIKGISVNYFQVTRYHVAMHAKWRQRGSRGAAWQHGICGAHWTPFR